MDREREAELKDLLISQKHQEGVAAFIELLAIRREQHRDRLEREEDAVVRGKSQECKALLQIFD